ncbi:KH domain-containing, RNA-binding, signal transduction-associated protein 2-like, partial [Penaeus monodon]|uniref:KH domain-containing, RNA-binding, signal transduction-associated protein 2-like n=1 Tax=Penaeus monodon TaxID=6687 RepID=UPI0018A7D42B
RILLSFLSVSLTNPLLFLPQFNFVGKLLGPKGNSMKRLQEETMTKMAVLGRGSMRDKQKEEELRASGDPKYVHLTEDLHVEITAFASPAEAHARIAYALAEVRRYLVPDNNDDIRKEQIREMELISDPQAAGGATATSGGGGGGGGGAGDRPPPA